VVKSRARAGARRRSARNAGRNAGSLYIERFVFFSSRVVMALSGILPRSPIQQAALVIGLLYLLWVLLGPAALRSAVSSGGAAGPGAVDLEAALQGCASENLGLRQRLAEAEVAIVAPFITTQPPVQVEEPHDRREGGGETSLRNYARELEAALQGQEEFKEQLRALRKDHQEVVREHGLLLRRVAIRTPPLSRQACRPHCGLNITADPRDNSQGAASGALLPRPRRRESQAELKAAARQHGLIFLRVQKTAGSTFEAIAGSECSKLNVECDRHWHLDWNLASHFLGMARYASRIVVTWLRDPVERLMSEYKYLQKVPAFEQAQWDYGPRIQQVLRFWRRSDDALELSPTDFTAMSSNPANNRQTLYLLGFNRPDIFGCGDTCTNEDSATCEECSHAWERFVRHGGTEPGDDLATAIYSAQGVPAAVLIERAKRRLSEDVDLFGLVDCFDSSLRYLSRSLGWDVEEATRMSRYHLRTGGDDYADPLQLDAAARSRALSVTRHRDELPEEVVRAIEGTNSLDVALHRFAKELLNQRMREVDPSLTCP